MHNAHIVTLAGIAFYLDEPAYHALTSYIKSVEKHFETSADKTEIVADIEHRIAECFSEKISHPTAVISKKHVDDIIAVLGKAEQFDDMPESDETGEKYEKTMMRDTQNGMVAGVAAGIGAYFAVDPLFVRIAFVLFTLLGGSGVVLYLVLWVLIPEAKTSSDRLRMRGAHVNVENIAQQLRETGAQLGKEGRKAAARFQQNSEGRTALGSVFARVFGTILTAAGGVALFIYAFGSMAMIVAKDQVLSGTPFAGFPSTPNEYFVVIVAFQIIAIPILAIILGGVSLRSGRTRRGLISFISLMLWILWFLALSIVFSSVAKNETAVRQEAHALDQKIELNHPGWKNQ